MGIFLPETGSKCQKLAKERRELLHNHGTLRTAIRVCQLPGAQNEREGVNPSYLQNQSQVVLGGSS